jgi:ribosomal protein S18 acetylase RimI-like enzyme
MRTIDAMFTRNTDIVSTTVHMKQIHSTTTKDGKAVEIFIGFSEPMRERIAQIYDAAFGEKLGIALPEPAARLRVLAGGLDARHALVALVGNEIAGVLGFKTPNGSLTGGISFSLIRQQVGLLRAVRAVCALSLFRRPLAVRELLLDGIAVAASMRGYGVGTALLRAICSLAEDMNYDSLRLDVINTNPDAQRLYERFGFTAVRIEHFPMLQPWLGFSAATQMAYRLQ